MNDRDHEWIEVELERLSPAKPPAEFITRLAAAQPGLPARREAGSGQVFQPDALRRLMQWLAPVTTAAAVVVALLLWQSPRPGGRAQGRSATALVKPALKADDVEIDRRLVAAFDAVAQMPGGEPVRFRCREWADEVVLRDSTHGIVVERRTPRVEIMPVRFEIY